MEANQMKLDTFPWNGQNMIEGLTIRDMPLKTIISKPLYLDTIFEVAFQIMQLTDNSLYSSGSHIVHTRPEFCDVLHVCTVKEIQALAARCCHFVDDRGNVQRGLSFNGAKEVYKYLASNLFSITTHVCYPTYPAWKPNLTKRQIDAILANHHNAQRKEGAK